MSRDDKKLGTISIAITAILALILCLAIVEPTYFSRPDNIVIMPLNFLFNGTANTSIVNPLIFNFPILNLGVRSDSSPDTSGLGISSGTSGDLKNKLNGEQLNNIPPSGGIFNGSPSFPTPPASISINGSKPGFLDETKLSNADKKLSTNLLELVDSQYIPQGQSKSDIIASMEKQKQYVPANTYSNGGKSNDEMVYVYVTVAPTASTHVVDPYAWQVTDRDEPNHVAAAWVEVKNLEALASLDGVSGIRAVTPPSTK